MENKNLFESFADMQKQAAATFSNAAETMQKAMFGGSGVDFNSDYFKKWYDSQMAWFNQNNGDAKSNQAMEYFNNWMNNQVKMAQSWMDLSKNMFQDVPQMNKMNQDFTNMMNLFNSWKNTMNGAYSEMLSNFNNDTAKNSFSGMFNTAEMYMKAFELMMPVMKSLSENTFTPESFRQNLNFGMYKEMLDKMFNMQPDYMKNMMDSFNASLKDNMGKMMDMNKSMYDTLKNSYSTGMQSMIPNDMFGNMFNAYNTFNTQLNNAFAPIMRLMPANEATHTMEVMKEISNMMAVYNLKNSQLQYMMYSTGMKAMDTLAENLYAKVRNGEDIRSFMPVYQDWLAIHDKQFISLFETEEYSKLMSEVSALQLTLKKKIENQVEKSLSTLPLINRTEMDELYKTIYELKKRINTLEKQLDSEEEITKEEPKAAPAKKSAKNA